MHLVRFGVLICIIAISSLVVKMSSSDNDESSQEEDFEGEPTSSPANKSPVPSSSEPPSSNRPDEPDNSSPPRPSPDSSPARESSFSSDGSPHPKRKRYVLKKPEVPYNAIYWPPPPDFSDNEVEVINPTIGESTNDPSDGVPLQQSCDEISSASDLMEASNSVLDQSLIEDDDADLTLLVAFEHTDENLPTDPPANRVDVEEDGCGVGTAQSDTSSSTSAQTSSSEESDSDVSDSDQQSESTDQGEESSSSSDSEAGSDAGFNFGSLNVYEGCALTVDEGVYLLMDLFMKQKLKKTTLECFLKILLKFIPENHCMPRTRHALFKYVEDICPPEPPIIHYYCQRRHFYVGKEDGKCSVCDGSSCNRFFQLLVANQIKNFFETLNLAEIIDKYAAERVIQTDGKYSDLLDGTEFKRVQVPAGKYNLTLLAHTDGISIAESSTVSLWPLEFVIAEVPPKLRFKFVLFGAVWVDTSKPTMHCFFKPTTEEFKELASNGVKWVNPKTKKQECSIVVAPCLCGDAPVRAEAQNILSVGGKRCCNSCELKMVKLPAEPPRLGVKKKRRKRIFYPQETPLTLRTAERMEVQGEECRRQLQMTGKLVPVKGVKGTSILSEFPSCNPSTAVYPEYMHSVFGIILQFMGFWFESDLPCNLKGHRDEINAMLGRVKRPDCVTRCPKTTERFTKWKANDCRSFLLYLSVIILSKFMTDKYLQHWMLFVSAVYLLLQEVVTESDILKAEIMLRLFLRDFPKFYPLESLAYNLHNLSHYGLSVRRVGPCWASSAFFWEDLNGSLSKRIHGTKNQGIELVNRMQLFQGVQVLRSRFENKATSSHTVFRSEIMDFELNDVQKNLMVASGVEPAIRAAYYRADFSGEIFTCKLYERQKEKNNFTICYLDSAGVKRYGEIGCFVESSDDTKIAFIDCFAIEHVRMICHDSGVALKHIIPIKETDEIVLVPLQNVLFKVMRVESYVCIRPNKYEVNL